MARFARFARFARLLCVLGVLSLSTSAFATVIPITDEEPDDSFATATVLTIGRVGTERMDFIDDGTLTIDAADSDYFKVKLQVHDFLTVITQAFGATTTVQLYDSNEDLLTAGDGAVMLGGAGWINGVSAEEDFYIRVTGSGSASYVMLLSINNEVPEPATMSLLAIGGAILLIKHRKKI